MPIKIPDKLPAFDSLKKENIFVMKDDRAYHQDIRPLKIAILNLMPIKIITEVQLLRLIGNTSLQVEIDLLHPATHKSKNTSENHLMSFYKTFDEVKENKYDGLIITGAPVEKLAFSDVTYWNELKKIMDWSVHNVFSTMHICWASQAGLYHHYSIPKYDLPSKLFGVYPHTINEKYIKLFRGFDDKFYVPQSRHTEIRIEDIKKVPELKVLSESQESGIYIVMAKNGRQIFVTGHSEYDPMTLKHEYDRDLAKGMDVTIPKNYYPDNDSSMAPVVLWRGHSNLLFSNWLNYYVYQETPYNLENID